MAQRLFDNLLNYCAAYSPPAKTTAVVLPDGDVRLKLLDATGLKYRTAADLLDALADRQRHRRRRRHAGEPEEAGRRRPTR